MFFSTIILKYVFLKKFKHNPRFGSGSKLGQNSGSGTKFKIFGSTTTLATSGSESRGRNRLWHLRQENLPIPYNGTYIIGAAAQGEDLRAFRFWLKIDAKEKAGCKNLSQLGTFLFNQSINAIRADIKYSTPSSSLAIPVHPWISFWPSTVDQPTFPIKPINQWNSSS